MRTCLLVVALTLAVAACDDSSTAPREAAHNTKEAPQLTITSNGIAITDATIRRLVPNAPSSAAIAKLKQQVAVPKGTLPVKVTDPWTGGDFGVPTRGDCRDEFAELVYTATELTIAFTAMDFAIASGNPVAITAAAAALAKAIRDYQKAATTYYNCETGVPISGGGVASGGTGGGASGGGGSSGGGDVDLGTYYCTEKLNVKTCVPVRGD